MVGNACQEADPRTGSCHTRLSIMTVTLLSSLPPACRPMGGLGTSDGGTRGFWAFYADGSYGV